MSRIADSSMYAHLWGTDELRDHFSEAGRLDAWLDILVALADAQAKNGLIPHAAAAQIATHAHTDRLDLDYIAAETRATSHSTLGLIRGLEQVLPPDVSQYVYYGATVQDITDTWAALTMKRMGAVAWRDLRAIEKDLLDMAVRHRSTVMAGRTHGQIGSPITAGFKIATWADEIRRHLHRLREGQTRWLVGQLAGSVGTLAFFGDHGLAVRADYCSLLGLFDPVVSWTTTRDRVVEFSLLMAMIATTLARIGDEIYELQRPEIGEFGEAGSTAAVGSITMPHKRNPEGSEHLVTLGRLIRSHAQTILDGSVQSHERDGRGWKVEWVAFPEICLLTGASLRITRDLVGSLDVDPHAMRRNLDQTRGYWASEAVLATLATSLGKHRAQDALFSALRDGWSAGRDLKETILSQPALAEHLTLEAIEELLDTPPVHAAAEMVDLAVARATTERQDESDEWP